MQPLCFQTCGIKVERINRLYSCARSSFCERSSKGWA